VLICDGELSGLQFVDVFLRKERRVVLAAVSVLDLPI